MGTPALGETADRIEAFYRVPQVRERIREYAESGPGGALRSTGAGEEIHRPLQDRRGTLLHLELACLGPSGSAPARPAGVELFEVLEPAYRAVQEAFFEQGVVALAMITSRGYEYTVRVPARSPLHTALVALGTGVQPGSPPEARAHEGAGRLLEHLAHDAVRKARAVSRLPVVLGEDPDPDSPATVCLILSAHAAALPDARIPCVFSLDRRGAGGAAGAPALRLPRKQHPLPALLEARRSLEGAAWLASEVRAAIPDTPARAVRWAETYLASPLAAFHREFDAQVAGEPMAREPEGLPPCASGSLAERGSVGDVGTLVASLWGLGLSPGSVAQLLVRRRSDARAAYHVRLACAALASGLLPAEAVTCRKQALRGHCAGGSCGADLQALASAAVSGRARP